MAQGIFQMEPIAFLKELGLKGKGKFYEDRFSGKFSMDQGKMKHFSSKDRLDDICSIQTIDTISSEGSFLFLMDLCC